VFACSCLVVKDERQTVTIVNGIVTRELENRKQFFVDSNSMTYR